MLLNISKSELHIKIVYYGPALSGKTTNLQYIHSRVPPNLRGDLVSLKTRGDRTLFFDYMVLEVGTIAGMRPKFSLYTVPGQVYYTATRRLVLQGADGIVFVADSHPLQWEHNLRSFRDLRMQMADLGMDPRTVPLVVQFNKRDLPNAVPVQAMHSLLSLDGTSTFESIATEGVGVLETLKAIMNRSIARVQEYL
ncbi:MAG TPA: gliding-motility protein MglA [Chloroflexi bacterium]|nr:gliding-motility protein MglA [Chloroflexota bacterium]